MVEVHSLKALRAWLNARAGWLFLAGLGMVAAWNWRKWRQDRALALRLRAQKPEPVQLQSRPKVSVLVAVGLLVSGAFYFRRMEKTFADAV
jgi:hypothetical protein